MNDKLIILLMICYIAAVTYAIMTGTDIDASKAVIKPSF